MQSNNFSADSLYRSVSNIFSKIHDYRSNHGNIKISISDALMSGLAIFALKFPSLLKFEEARKDENKETNLLNLFPIKRIPSDTQAREILDHVTPEDIRPAYRKIFSIIQRGNKLKDFQYMDDGRYIIPLDGTEEFGSTKIKCPQCLVKKFKNRIEYRHQLLSGIIAHPEIKQVIPLFPEPITNYDGSSKQDCEANAAKRWIKKFKRDHPKLKAVVVEDCLSANYPHVKLLNENDLKYIIGVKPKKQKYLFEQFEINKRAGIAKFFEIFQITGDKIKKRITHRFQYINELAINNSHPDYKVNFLDYEEITEYLDPSQDKKGIGTTTKHFTWITDYRLDKSNIYKIMRAGRCRWKVENENFKTLKDESSYNLEHSYGHGEKHLCTIFALLAILSFLIDQTQEIGCSLFNKVLRHVKRKLYLWEMIRGNYKHWIYIKIESWLFLYKCIPAQPPKYGHPSARVR